MALSENKSPSTGMTYWSNTSASPKHFVLCIAGWGCSGSDYQALVQALAPDSPNTLYIAPDQPGHGASPPSLCPEPSISGFAKLLKDLCKEVAPSLCNGMLVIGHSMGCRTALEFFSQSPGEVAGIILLDGNWHGQKPVDRTPPPPGAWPVEAAIQGLEGSFGPHTPHTFKEELRQLFRNLDIDYLILSMIDNRAWDAERMLDVLQQVQNVNANQHAVTLLLVQATDGASGPRRSLKKGEESVWMKTAKENAGDGCGTIVIEESGHWPHVDRVDEVVQAVLPLIQIR